MSLARNKLQPVDVRQALGRADLQVWAGLGFDPLPPAVWLLGYATTREECLWRAAEVEKLLNHSSLGNFGAFLIVCDNVEARRLAGFDLFDWLRRQKIPSGQLLRWAHAIRDMAEAGFHQGYDKGSGELSVGIVGECRLESGHTLRRLPSEEAPESH